MAVVIKTKTHTLIRTITHLQFAKNIVRKLSARQLVFTEFGDPQQVLKISECELPHLGSNDVLVQMLAAPINPADINTIQGNINGVIIIYPSVEGDSSSVCCKALFSLKRLLIIVNKNTVLYALGKYPVKIRFPCVPGNEGVGIINEVGSAVSGMCTGNKVVMAKPALGTWRDLAVFNEKDLRVVPDCLGVVEAATLNVNPCTAYRMLSDFVPVREKCSVVIQNGANSACGQYVIQLCKAWQVPTVNIVRQRPDIVALKSYLTCLGANYVLTEQELRETSIFKEGKIEKPSLALNNVGGKSVISMLKHIQHSSTVVTYGGMSKQPVSIPTSAFIFNNISFKGFWLTAWSKQASSGAQDCMLKEITDLMCHRVIVAPTHKMVKFEQYKEAICNALNPKGFTGCKYLLDFGQMC